MSDSRQQPDTMIVTVSFQNVQEETRSDPRQAIVLFGQSPAQRIVSDDQGTNFFGLPRKIRDMIYSNIFVKPTRIGEESKFTKPFWRDAILWRSHAFAETCRRVWNESLHIFLSENGFEYYLIRPFLEFLEKIGIRGRRILRHHHVRSLPFIAIRYLRSCTNLRTLEVFERVRVKIRPGFLYDVPMLDARRFFLSSYTTIGFDHAIPLGKGAGTDEPVPDFRSRTSQGEYEEGSLRTLSEVKWEISGEYRRYDLPRIHENGMCHWKYEMLDEMKRKRKEKDDTKTESGGAKRHKTTSKQHSRSENGQKEGNNDGSTDENGSTDLILFQENQPQDELDEEAIDKANGYAIEAGNLVKDGILVAKGHIFESETMPEAGTANNGGNANHEVDLGRLAMMIYHE